MAVTFASTFSNLIWFLSETHGGGVWRGQSGSRVYGGTWIAERHEEDIMLNRPLRLGIRHRALVLDFWHRLTPLAFALLIGGLIMFLF
jgi:hypothetical protein